MAAKFENFGLTDLVARPEDAFRLASLAMAEGQRIRGYRGDYFRCYVGDATVVVRAMPTRTAGRTSCWEWIPMPPPRACGM